MLSDGGNRRRLVAGILFTVLASMAGPGRGQTGEQLETGTLLPRVACLNDSGKSYALYLPKAYDPARTWPVLLAFDPGGRGTAAVNTFQESAEQYGWIVAGSNDVRNGPWSDNIPGIKALWADVMTRFAVDSRRVYATGMSGGARVAGALAWIQLDQLAGVIACAAGLPEGVKFKANEIKASYLSVIGIRDFNLLEVKRLDPLLDSLGIFHSRLVFDGGHSWPPPGAAREALEWMERQAMIEGRRSKDENLLQQWWDRQTGNARKLETEGNLLAAGHVWRNLVREYDGLLDVTTARTEAARICSMKEYAGALEEDRRLEQQEAEAMGEAAYIWKTRFAPGAPLPDFGRLVKDLRLDERVKRISKKNGSPAELLSCRRVLNLILVLSTGDWSLMPGAPAGCTILGWRLAGRILPENAAVQVNLAAAYASSGQNESALQALREAVRLGFKDRTLLETEAGLASLRQDPRFQQLLKEMAKLPVQGKVIFP